MFTTLNMTEFATHQATDQGQRTLAETIRRRTPVLIAGLPGKMATLIAGSLERDGNFWLHHIGLSSERHFGETLEFSGRRIQLTQPDRWPIFFTEPRWPYDMRGGMIAVDFTTPESALTNAQFYTTRRLPFVMGTTSPHREQIEKLVRNSEISAVIAPNMAIEVVELQDKFTQLAETSPHAFQGWHTTIRESHQAAKRDVSGTAKAFQAQLERLSAIMDGEIESIRDPQTQRQLEIQNIDGHAYHWIELTGPNGETEHFTTAIEGRQPYVEGTLMAVRFLARRMKEGSRGEVFTMSDVIRERREVAE